MFFHLAIYLDSVSQANIRVLLPLPTGFDNVGSLLLHLERMSKQSSVLFLFFPSFYLVNDEKSFSTELSGIVRCFLLSQ